MSLSELISPQTVSRHPSSITVGTLSILNCHHSCSHLQGYTLDRLHSSVSQNTSTVSYGYYTPTNLLQRQSSVFHNGQLCVSLCLCLSICLSVVGGARRSLSEPGFEPATSGINHTTLKHILYQYYPFFHMRMRTHSVRMFLSVEYCLSHTPLSEGHRSDERSQQFKQKADT